MNLLLNSEIILKDMMLYLTGAQTPLTKSGGASPQSDVNKSLGGYISSSPVPNGALNIVFDLISAYTLEKRTPETLAFALVNKFDRPVTDVELKIVTDEGNQAQFRIAAVAVDSESMTMEHISNRYEQPINAQFHDVSFYRAAVDVKINNPASKGEEIVFYPMNVVVEVKESGLEGTWDAIFDAFDNDDTYVAKRLTAETFRIERRDEAVLSEPVACSYISTEGSSFTFEGELRNKANNTVLLSEELAAGACIGIWIQRVIKNSKPVSNEQLIKNFKEGFNYPKIEEVDLVINYNETEEPKQYEEEEYNEEYS